MYKPAQAELDADALPEGFRDLGRAMLYFRECVLETRDLANALSKGDLKYSLPSSENETAAPLKALYASLKHLAWQTQQVAHGDYKQRVIFMGDFAEAFNSMVVQLEQRQADLLEAKIVAEAASRSKSAFLATMSHEIRTPLNAIIGLSEIVLSEELPGHILDNLEKIYSSGAVLLGIVNDILDISKIEAGGLEMVPVDFSVLALLNDTVQLNATRIGPKNITFELEIDESIPLSLYGDELRVKQILNNLLSNAFKYTKKGKVTLKIGWLRMGDDAVMNFTVTDTGIGIKEEDMSKLFSEYTQLDAKANRHIEGTGLGLSITKGLVEMMGGGISVESQHGVGSSFRAVVPLKIADETPIGHEAANDLKKFRFANSGQRHGERDKNFVRAYMPGGRVLVVDDVATNLDVARGFMIPYGLSVDCTSSGMEAIEKIRVICRGEVDVSRYDVIFMDHMMPEMDGIEATRVIRRMDHEYARTVPIVALTANALSGSEEMFLSNGFNGFISKPIDLLRLDLELNKWVPRSACPESGEKPREIMPRGEGGMTGAMLDGVDIEAGIRRYGEEALYLQILRSYAANTPALIEKLRKPSEAALKEYAITVHGLKGSSLGICADEIARQAEVLERAAKSGDFEKVSAANAAFLEQAEALLSDLDSLLRTKDDAAVKKNKKNRKPFPDSSLLEKMLAAAVNLKTSQMEEIIEELDSYDYDSNGELVAWLKCQMDSLAYDAIAERLKE
ncbi:MAG: response regulator [Synergistaceae bacterium]|jgi:signal transduction histidine kinase/CheY-like chemotaxis protein|nr:response regulator [Synergistaceae bacterium]